MIYNIERRCQLNQEHVKISYNCIQFHPSSNRRFFQIIFKETFYWKKHVFIDWYQILRRLKRLNHYNIATIIFLMIIIDHQRRTSVTAIRSFSCVIRFFLSVCFSCFLVLYICASSINLSIALEFCRINKWSTKI